MIEPEVKLTKHTLRFDYERGNFTAYKTDGKFTAYVAQWPSNGDSIPEYYILNEAVDIHPVLYSLEDLDAALERFPLEDIFGYFLSGNDLVYRVTHTQKWQRVATITKYNHSYDLFTYGKTVQVTYQNESGTVTKDIPTIQLMDTLYKALEYQKSK